MNKLTLKGMIKEEIRYNAVFRKGRHYTQSFIILYGVIRFSDPLFSSILAEVPLEGVFHPAFSVLTVLCIAFLCLLGSVKLAGVLCMLTSISNVIMLFTSARNYTGGFTEMMTTAPIAWYLIGAAVLSVIVGLGLLLNKWVTAFSIRRKELQREYVALLRERETGRSSDGK